MNREERDRRGLEVRKRANKSWKPAFFVSTILAFLFLLFVPEYSWGERIVVAPILGFFIATVLWFIRLFFGALGVISQQIDDKMLDD